MRILHIWEQGISSTISKWMDRIYQTKSIVIGRKDYDKFGHNIYGINVEGKAFNFYLKILIEVLKTDIIHVHSCDEIMPWITRFGKPTILHYHGSDIRGKWDKKMPLWKRADALRVSTLDLLQGGPGDAQWQPNPVDTDIFFPQGVPSKEAICLSYNADEEAKRLALKYNLKIDIISRKIQRINMPKLFHDYSHFIDIKNVKGAVFNEAYYQSGSLTGLEALACGLKVVNPFGIKKGLPETHNPKNVVSNLFKLYNELINN